MFLTYFKIYLVRNSSGGSRKRLKSGDKRRCDFKDNVTKIHANSHSSNSSIFSGILRACNDQKNNIGYTKRFTWEKERCIEELDYASNDCKLNYSDFARKYALEDKKRAHFFLL